MLGKKQFDNPIAEAAYTNMWKIVEQEEKINNECPSKERLLRIEAIKERMMNLLVSEK